jgi:ABC-type Na+ efflux pump permease subunit
MACNTGQANLNLGDCFLLNKEQTVSEIYPNASTLVNLLTRYIFVAAGFIIFGLIIYAGFLFMTDESKGKDRAQEILTSALIGFIIMFCAYWIIQIIVAVTGADLGVVG